MKTGKVAIGHCKYTATDIKNDGNELVGSHILAIKHAAEHNAKHRRGVEQYRGRGHAHLAHALVIKRVSGGEAHGRDAVYKDSDAAPHKRGDQHQHIAQIAFLQRSLLGIVSNMFHTTL